MGNELNAARSMMQHAISNYCKLKELVDCGPVIKATESKIEYQLYREEKVTEITREILRAAGPVDPDKFMNMASKWSWNLNIAEVARELDNAGIDPDEEYWTYYGDLFVMFFSNSESEQKENEQHWETLGYILSEFCTNGLHL